MGETLAICLKYVSVVSILTRSIQDAGGRMKVLDVFLSGLCIWDVVILKCKTQEHDIKVKIFQTWLNLELSSHCPDTIQGIT